MALSGNQVTIEQSNQGGALSHHQQQQQQSHFTGSFYGLSEPKKARTHLVDYLSSRSRVPYRYNHEKVINYARNHPPFLYRMNLMKKLPVHDGCVNTICWNKTGEYILSGSDDCNLCVTKPAYLFDSSKDYTVLHKIPTRHLGNIFSAQFIPNSNDSLLVSCSSDGPVIVHDINSENPSQGVFNFNCHSSSIFEVLPLQDDDKVFLSCGEDKTVRLFDMRCHKSCANPGTCPHPALIRNSHPMTTLSVHPLNSNLLMVGRADGIGLIYDRRKLPDPSKFSREKAHADYLASQQLSKGQQIDEQRQQVAGFKYLHPLEGVVSKFTVPDMEEKCRFTSLCFSQDGRQVLASYSQNYIYLFNHDRSSNLELVQTLPRKCERMSSVDINNHNLDSANSGSGSGRPSSIQVNNPRVSMRAPRIRVRGDWSDTGINSVPNSARESQSNNNSSHQIINSPNFLQRMTYVALELEARRSARPRFIPLTEIVAGSRQSFLNESTNTASNDRSVEEGSGEEDEEDVEEAGGEQSGDQEEANNDYRLSDNNNNNNSANKPQRQQTADEPSPIRTDNDDSQTSPQSRLKDKFRNLVADMKKYDKIDTYHPHVRYQGHRNSRTSIKEAIFWGEDYVMSGSDCGRIMIWEKNTARLVMGFPADERVVNCLAPNPRHYALASSGIDYDIKLWSTQNIYDCPLRISEDEMDAIVKNNELMLEEAKQTIVVPPHLFFRVLASFAQNRLS